MDKLIKFLEAAGYDQKTFADMVKTSPATLCRVLAGDHEPKLRLAVAIEKATNGKVKCRDWVR